MMAEVMERTMKIMKNEVNPSMGIPNSTGMGLAGSGYRVLKSPAMRLEAAVDRNHTPIKRQAKRGGESLDTMDRPMGEMQSSPRVIMKYTPTR